jgi:hypothetical protein
MKLYENITEKKMGNFLKKLGSSLEKEKLVEIRDDEAGLHGDFIVIKGYKFKKSYGTYQCLETPTDKHVKIKHIWPRGANDYYKK